MKKKLPKYIKKKIIISSIIGVLATLILVAVCGGLYFYSRFNHVLIDKDNDNLGIEQIRASDDGITNIALYGVDDGGNSDSIMIISINENVNKIKLISLLRDSLVKVEPKDKKAYYTKINEAYDHGPETAIKTLNSNYNLDITDYASIHFDGMVTLIDSIGGIDMSVTKDEMEMINGLIDTTEDLKGPKLGASGDVHLNGNQAVAYSRIRYINNKNGQFGDYGRTDRQRAVMEQLFNKALKMKPSQYPSFVNAMLPSLETSLQVNQILALAGMLSKGGVTLEQTRVPNIDYTIDADYKHNGKSTVYYSLDYASKLINAFIFDDISPEDYMNSNESDVYGPLGEKGPKIKNSSGSSVGSSSTKSNSNMSSKSSL